MAIYNFSSKIISRSKGKSAVAAAAYRACEELHDERIEKTFDYTKKGGLVHSEILAPEHAPLWMKDRERLWNGVEAAEKRKDAQLARDFVITLPRELTSEQNKILIREFIQRQFVDKGMVADLCLHEEVDKNGDPQPHAHVMLTMREVTSEGFGAKTRSWNSKVFLKDAREQWAYTANHHLALNGFSERIDHRSLKDQGIDLEPQHKRGHRFAHERLIAAQDHARIARENGNKILKDPTIALHALSQGNATFTREAIACFVNRHTEDGEQFQAVYAAVFGSAELVPLGKDMRGYERFTTKAMIEMEGRLLALVDHLGSTVHEHAGDLKSDGIPSVDQGETVGDVSTSLISAALIEKVKSGKNLSEEQDRAVDHLLSGERLKSVIGYAGTGKSYVLGVAREAWEDSGFRVRGATLAGITAEQLESGSGISSKTLASYFYRWEKGEELLTQKDILVVDEAGLLGTRQFVRLLEVVDDAQASIAFVGDGQQLQSIESGHAFRMVTERSPTVELVDIRRQREEWQKTATFQMAKGEVPEALMAYDSKGHVHATDTVDEARRLMLAQWNEARIAHPDETQLIMAYTRQEVRVLNECARSIRVERGELGEPHGVMTERGERHFAKGDRMMFLKNDTGLGIKNGTLGTVIDVGGSRLTVQLDSKCAQGSKERAECATGEEGRVVEVPLHFYKAFDYGYATTLYKAQGVTVDRSFILASSHFDCHGTYVALSRHRESADLFYSKEAFPNTKHLYTSLSRDGRKDLAFDYYHPLFFENRVDFVLDAVTRNNALFSKKDLVDTIERYGQGLDSLEKENLFSDVLASDRLIRVVGSADSGQRSPQDNEKENNERNKRNEKNNQGVTDQKEYSTLDVIRMECKNRHLLDQLLERSNAELESERIEGVQGMREMRVKPAALVTEEIEKISVKNGHGVTLSTTPVLVDREKLIRDVALSKTLKPEQEQALQVLVSTGSVKCLMGYAGTGKSHLLGAAREVWEQSGYRVTGATLAGKAAESLSRDSGIATQTLASLFSKWDRGEDHLSAKDILVVDEAGLIGTVAYARLLEEVYLTEAKVVFAGDTSQNQAIEQGAPFRMMHDRLMGAEKGSEKSHLAYLIDVVRQKEGWQRNATKQFAMNQPEEALSAYQSQGCFQACNTEKSLNALDETLKGILDTLNPTWLIEVKSHPSQQTGPQMKHAEVVDAWNQERLLDHAPQNDLTLDTDRTEGIPKEKNKTHLMIGYTRKDVDALNVLAHHLRQERGELGPAHVVQTSQGPKEFSVGEQLYLMKNDPDLPMVKNGTFGTLMTVDGNRLVVQLLEGPGKHQPSLPPRNIYVAINEYPHVDYGYATTIYKSQGITVDRSIVLAHPGMRRQATHVALSRHREGTTLFWDERVFKEQERVIHCLSRDGSKKNALDYLSREEAEKLIPMEQGNSKLTLVAGQVGQKVDQKNEHHVSYSSSVPPSGTPVHRSLSEILKGTAQEDRIIVPSYVRLREERIQTRKIELIVSASEIASEMRTLQNEYLKKQGPESDISTRVKTISRALAQSDDLHQLLRVYDPDMGARLVPHIEHEKTVLIRLNQESAQLIHVLEDTKQKVNLGRLSQDAAWVVLKPHIQQLAKDENLQDYLREKEPDWSKRLDPYVQICRRDLDLQKGLVKTQQKELGGWEIGE